MRIIFMGTPDFSSAVFEKLNSVYPVTAVVTGPDKPVGRKGILTPCPLKTSALNAGVQVLQYSKVSREGLDDIRALNPDLVVTAAFGQILSDAFLQIPKFGIINVHASLLPKWRGASPIQSAILNGDKETGITIMRTVKEVDAGAILLQRKCEISPDEYSDTLFDKLAVIGGEALVEAVKLIDEGKAVYVEQNHDEATHCAKFDKESGAIDWDKTPDELHSFVHAMNPWPSAYTHLNDKTIKIIEVEKSNLSGEVGRILSTDKKHGLVVGCKNGSVRIVCLQPESKCKMDAVSFLNGNKVAVGDKFD